MGEDTATRPAAQGIWSRRPGGPGAGFAQDTFVQRGIAGDENVTAVFNHDSDTGVPTLRMNGTAGVPVLINGQGLPNPTAA